MELKQLEAGKNYVEFYFIGREDQIGNRKMIYNGGISWTAVSEDGKMLTKDSQEQTDSLIAYINDLPKGFIKNGVLING